ncbi:MAG: MBOAT family protein [Candidatus Dormibacteria bacterium]
MPFNSLQYALFLPIVVALYWVFPSRRRPTLLLVASYLFYASYSAPLLLLIIALTAVNYSFGRALDRGRHQPRASTALLALAVSIDLGVLAFYKYTLFLLHSVARVLGLVGSHPALPEPSIILPLGISFFTFEFIHYLIEVKRGSQVIRSPLRFALFAAFFPTQIAGPIKRYQSFIPQLERLPVLEWAQIGDGLRLISIGLFKKVVLADNLAPLVAVGFGAATGGELPVGDAWLAVIAFAMQIYFDFSGFTDIARGSARMLGFRVPENFHRPYMAVNPSDFWRRWHMSLSSWLRDYLYIPLGGNRRRRYVNLFLTMLIGGLWHGAAWTFVIWGAFHGALLTGYWGLRRALGDRLGEHSPLPLERALLTLASRLATFILVCVGWVFFRASNFGQAMHVLRSMTGMGGGGNRLLTTRQSLFILAVAAGCLAVEGVLECRELWEARRGTAWHMQDRLLRLAWYAQPVGYALLLSLTLLLRPSEGPPFIYFHF